MAKGKPKDEPQEDDSESGSSHDGAKSDQETEPPPSGPFGRRLAPERPAVQP